MVKIVVDTPTKEGLGFKGYAEALVNIILDSESPFTIGILGEWGVGKTSMMQTMLEKLKAEKNGVIPVWFNAWRCEREKIFAIIPLLELLVGEIKEKELKQAFIGFLKSIQLKFVLPGGAEISAGGGLQNQVEEALYYDKLEAIKTTLEKTKKKIVVFIDDLDRCAPDKILEVLESTKVFLDIKGFVYVLGLNSEVVVKAIDQKYKDMGIKGEDYLEKIVQIPFRIPDWNEPDRGAYLTYLIKNEIDSTYQKTFEDYKDIIQKVIERTPRQVKRFINTYICEQEVFKGKKLNKTIHLILTILKFKWYDFYHNLFNPSYRQKLKEVLSDENKLKEELKDKEDLIDFIKVVRKPIDEIIEMADEQLFEYRRAGMIIPQKIIKPEISREKLIDLLRSGMVSVFNALRKRNREGIDLHGAYLHGATLSKVNLSKADLIGAVLSSADLNDADLSEADLSEAVLRRTDLRRTDLSKAVLPEAVLRGADLYMADLSGAVLRETDLREAYLIGTDLSKADLSKADLSQGVILVTEPKYQETEVEAANFNNTSIGDSGFLEYLKKNDAENVPDGITNKDKIINLLKNRGYDSSVIARIMKQFF